MAVNDRRKRRKRGKCGCGSYTTRTTPGDRPGTSLYECLRCEEARQGSNHEPAPGTQYAPVLDRILVRLLEPEKKTKGGVLLPDGKTSGQDIVRVEILAYGPGMYLLLGRSEDDKPMRSPMDYQVGQVALVSRQALMKLPRLPKGEQLYVVNEKEPLVVEVKPGS